MNELNNTNTNSKSKQLALLISTIVSALITVGLVVGSFFVPDSENKEKIVIALLTVAIILAGITVILGSNYFEIKKNLKVNHTLMIALGGIALALAFVLSFARLFRLPYGGSITLLSILPICLYSYMFGCKRGIVLGLLYGVLQIIQDMYVVHPVQLILDYPLAFGALGVAGCLKGKFSKIKKGAIIEIAIGMFIGLVGRFICHFLSGMVFFGEYAADYGMTPAIYCLAYDSFVFADGIPAIIVACAMFSSKYFLSQFNKLNK